MCLRRKLNDQGLPVGPTAKQGNPERYRFVFRALLLPASRVQQASAAIAGLQSPKLLAASGDWHLPEGVFADAMLALFLMDHHRHFRPEYALRYEAAGNE